MLEFSLYYKLWTSIVRLMFIIHINSVISLSFGHLPRQTLFFLEIGCDHTWDREERILKEIFIIIPTERGSLVCTNYGSEKDHGNQIHASKAMYYHFLKLVNILIKTIQGIVYFQKCMLAKYASEIGARQWTSVY